MATNIRCPQCGHQFDVENVIASELEERYRQQFQAQQQVLTGQLQAERQQLQQQQQEFEDKKRRENEIFAQKLQQEKMKLEGEIQEQLRKTISSDFETKIRMLEHNNQEQEEKLKQARRQELEFLQKQQELKNREAELEITLQRKIQEEREQLTEQIRKQELEKNQVRESAMQMKLKEVEMQLDEQKRLAEEMKRRAEQGSMQRQGEVQELLLEAMLRDCFPADVVEEVGKGVEGADCIQTVKSQAGRECGKIIYESKRTKNWSNTWIDKLKSDMRTRGADVAILVTQVYPKDMDKFGERDGVWICGFSEVTSVAALLRSSIIRVSDALRSQENKGDKMQMLYNYLTGNEFRGQMEAIVEGFMALRNGITKERIQMEKIWKEREKQLEKVLINTSGLYGSVKGIAGVSVSDIPLLEGGEQEETPSDL